MMISNDYSEKIPCLYSSSDYIYLNGRKKKGDIDDRNISTCFVLKPFAYGELKQNNSEYNEIQTTTSSNSIGICNREAIICLECGSILCPYSKIHDDGSWKCIFCETINPAFHSLSTSSSSISSSLGLSNIYKELNISHMNYITNNNCRYNDNINIHEKYPIHIYALDNYLCKDENVISLLYESLEKLANVDSEHIRVSIVICGNNSLNLLRLFDISNSSNTLAADILPGSIDQSDQISHLISQGIYTVTVGIMIQKFNIIKSSIVSFGEIEEMNDIPTIETIIGLGTTFAELKGPGSRLLLICSRVFPISKSTEVIVDDDTVLGLSKNKSFTSVSETAIVYSQLGKYAVSKGCYIDIFHASIIGTPKFDLLDGLAGATGGYLVIAESYNDDSLRSTFLKSIFNGVACSKNSLGNYIQKGTIATLEVRTCNKIHVDKFVGPILSGSECIETYFTNNDSNITTSSLTMNEDHVKYTIENALNSVDNHRESYKIPIFNIKSEKISIGNNKQKLTEKVQNKLLSSNDNQILCGLCRYYSNTHVAIQLKSNIKSAEEDTNTYAQFILRFKTVDGASVVRVWTITLKVTNLLSKFIDKTNERLWSTVTAQIITADYHDNCIDMFGGARKKNHDLHLRKRSLQYIKNLIKTITELFFEETDRFHPKLETIFRYMYHLSEGPLLDGPALYLQESALLRSHFLTASPTHASSIIQAFIQLVLIPNDVNTNTSDLTIVQDNFINVYADTCSLIPNAIALIDTGDNIIIRVGCKNFDGQEKDRIMKELINIVSKRMYERDPCPKVIILDVPWSNIDRLVFARLSPSHRDSKDFRILTPALKSLISDTVLDELVNNFSHTDQLTYYMYIWDTIPKYAKIYQTYHRRLSAPINNTIDRDVKGGGNNNPNEKTYKRKTFYQWMTGIKPLDDIHNESDDDDDIILSLP